MEYKLGLVSVSFRGNTPEQILQAMHNNGLGYIEWGSDVHCPPDDADKIAALQKNYGIVCCSYGTYFRLGVTPIDELAGYMQAAKRLGTNILRLWCGNKDSEEYSQDEKQVLFSECKIAADIAQKNGVVLCMECHNNTYTNTRESAYELMQAVNSKGFRMYWQPNQFRSEEDNMEYAKLLSPYTEHIHVFNWKGKEKYPLLDAKDVWQRYLTCFSGDRALLLEFMPDGRLETLSQETIALRKIVE